MRTETENPYYQKTVLPKKREESLHERDIPRDQPCTMLKFECGADSFGFRLSKAAQPLESPRAQL